MKEQDDFTTEARRARRGNELNFLRVSVVNECGNEYGNGWRVAVAVHEPPRAHKTSPPEKPRKQA